MGFNIVAYKGIATKIARLVTKKAGEEIAVYSPKTMAQHAHLPKDATCDKFVKTVEETIHKYTDKTCSIAPSASEGKVVKFNDGRIFEYNVTGHTLNGGNSVVSTLTYPNGVVKKVTTTPEFFKAAKCSEGVKRAKEVTVAYTDGSTTLETTSMLERGLNGKKVDARGLNIKYSNDANYTP